MTTRSTQLDANNRPASTVNADAGESFSHGVKSSIGSTAVKLKASAIVCLKGVLVKAFFTNTDVVYVGGSSVVTANSADATDGFPLSPGEAIVLDVADPSAVYLISPTAGQKVSWAAV